MQTVLYPWPSPSGYLEKPSWSGKGFLIGSSHLPILAYEVGSSGWTNELTRFHEETAGSNHFIDRASRMHALQQLVRYMKEPNPVVLDAGCSSGFMLRVLREHLPHAFVIGSDYVRGPLEKLVVDMPDVPLLHFDLVRCPLPEKSIDGIVLLNVLEHIQDDKAAVFQLHRVLKPGGIVVIEVPAGPQLYDVYDKLLLHCRRYTLAGLRRLVECAGFHVVEQSHLGFFVYPGFWLVKQRNKRFLSEGEVVQQQVVARNMNSTEKSRLLDMIMRIELMLGRWVSYPIGIRCLLTCVKAC